MMRKALVSVKRVVRPLIPDSVMARWRLRQHSQMVRNNVDVYESDTTLARRWLKLTPDTYRVVSGTPPQTGPSDVVTIGAVDAELTRYLGWHGSELVVRGIVDQPAMRGMRIVEPDINPLEIVTTADVMAELPVGSAPTAKQVLRAALDAGRRVGLVPEVTTGDIGVDSDPIQAPAVVVLSAVPLHDIGGGSRASQIAFELLRRGYHVTFVNRYPSSESSDLGLRYVHRNLEQVPFDRFAPSQISARSHGGTVIAEAPIREFLDALTGLKALGWTVIYDLIDDWTDQSLGGDWYDGGVEQGIIDLADGVAASAQDLVAHVARFGGDAVLVPNGVNEAVFGAAADTDEPVDLPDGPLMVYHGSLYGSWFDWAALDSVARAFPAYTIMVIGDARGVPDGLEKNITFLGLKPQGDLAGYLVRSDVGLVPFVVNEVTHAVSPLKVYEYLACGVAVAAPPLRPLLDLDGVHVNLDLPTAVSEALDAERPDRHQALADHSWGSRLETMLQSVGAELNPVSEESATIFRRSPVHHDKKDRWVRGG